MLLLKILGAAFGLAWVIGMGWAWGETSNLNDPWGWRALLIVFWPIVWLAEKIRIVAPAVLLALSAGAAMLYPGPTRADGIATRGADWVRIMAAECKNEAVIAAIRLHGKEPERFLAAAGHSEGHDFAGCWMPEAGHVYLVWEDGDQGLLSGDEFKPVPVA